MVGINHFGGSSIRHLVTPTNAAEALAASRARDFLHSGATLSGSIPKLSSWSSGGPQPTIYDDASRQAAQQMMSSHFPYSYGRKLILESPGISMGDRYDMLQSLDRAKAQEGGGRRGAISLKTFLPTVVGAGVGYLGASLLAPIFGMSPMQKNRFQIGSSALGAVLNNF
jgi:hypothetical protein